MTGAFYPGSFDPITYGHLDIIKRAWAIFDPLYVAIGVNPNKKQLLDLDSRLKLLEQTIAQKIGNAGSRVEVLSFNGLAVEVMRTKNIKVLVRGLRNTTDYNYEIQMANMNDQLASDIQTIFLTATPKFRHISASLVRQIAVFGGDLTPFLPIESQIAVKQALTAG